MTETERDDDGKRGGICNRIRAKTASPIVTSPSRFVYNLQCDIIASKVVDGGQLIGFSSLFGPLVFNHHRQSFSVQLFHKTRQEKTRIATDLRPGNFN